MKKCNFKKIPSREEIIEIINSNMSDASLQSIYQLAKLFQAADSEHPDLTQEEWTKYFIVAKLLMLDKLRPLKFVDNFLYYSMK